MLAADDAGRIRAGTKSWVESFNGGNAGAVVALYSEDAVLMPPGNYGFSTKFAWLNDRYGVSWQLNWQ